MIREKKSKSFNLAIFFNTLWKICPLILKNRMKKNLMKISKIKNRPIFPQSEFLLAYKIPHFSVFQSRHLAVHFFYESLLIHEKKKHLITLAKLSATAVEPILLDKSSKSITLSYRILTPKALLSQSPRTRSLVQLSYTYVYILENRMKSKYRCALLVYAIVRIKLLFR